MTTSATIESVNAAARESLAKLRSAAEEGSPLAKVVDLIDGLSKRLDGVEASFAESERTKPIPRRKV